MSDNDYQRNEKFLIKEDSYYAQQYSVKTKSNNTPNSQRNKNQHQNYNTRNNRPYRGRHRGRQNKHESSQARHQRSTKPNKLLEKNIFDGNEVEKGIDFDKYDDIPVEVTGDDIPECVSSFDEVENIHPQLLWNIERSGYSKPTPIQKYAISISINGRDIMAIAQTGSGKTAAFLLPMVQILLETGGPEAGNSHYSDVIKPIAIVLTPTRELAIQVEKQSRKFLYRTGMRSSVVYGGVSIWQQKREMRGGVDILVATPGRLVDFLEREEMAMDHVRFLVMDEADRMLDMGFEDQIRSILCPDFGMPPAGERQTMMFSATFPRPIQTLAQNFMGDYLFVTVGKVGGASDSVVQEVIYAESNDKDSILLDFFNIITDSVLIFVQRKISANRVERYLKKNGVNAMSIHGDKSQEDREYAMDSFKRGVCKVMVATDVASRGLDIPNVSFVVNYDMSNNIDDYIHRIGRTGRIGNKGTALTIITEKDSPKILRDLRQLLVDSNVQVPDWMDGLISRRHYEKSSRYGAGKRDRRGGGNRSWGQRSNGGGGRRYNR